MRRFNKLKFSVIIPARKINDYFLKTCLPAFKKQSFKNFEILLIPTVNTKMEFCFPSFVKVFFRPQMRPAQKRDFAAKKANGKFLAFIDDDAYPAKNWLKNALKILNQEKVAAVCGPGLTPAGDNIWEKISGFFWSSFISAGSLTFRSRKEPPRLVDDYPAFNFIIKKNVFLKAGGFKSIYWPGEDTKFCHTLVYKKKEKILYHPNIVVYHHRRKIFFPHLKQLARYGLHRGFFAKKYPLSSFKFFYFLPSLLFFLITLSLFFYKITFVFLIFYALLTLFFSFKLALKEKNFAIFIFLPPTIIISHLTYGIFFLIGFFKKKLKH